MFIYIPSILSGNDLLSSAEVGSTGTFDSTRFSSILGICFRAVTFCSSELYSPVPAKIIMMKQYHTKTHGTVP